MASQGTNLAVNLAKGKAYYRRAVSGSGDIELMGGEQKWTRYPSNPQRESR